MVGRTIHIHKAPSSIKSGHTRLLGYSHAHVESKLVPLVCPKDRKMRRVWCRMRCAGRPYSILNQLKITLHFLQTLALFWSWYLHRVQTNEHDNIAIRFNHLKPDTCTFSLKNRHSSISPSPSPSQCCISGLKVHFFGATLTRGEGGRHFAQTRPSRASKTERLANTCHIFRLSQGLLSRIVWIACAEAKTTITPTGFNVLRLNLDSKVFETLCTYSIYIWVILNRFIA